MNTNRLAIAVVVLAAVTIAAVTTSFAGPPQAASPSDDFALRHPAGLPAPSRPSDDFAVRHPTGLPGMNNSAAAYFAGSDYGERHASLLGADNSDFALRHPSWSIFSPVVDTGDYYLRHPELTGLMP